MCRTNSLFLITYISIVLYVEHSNAARILATISTPSYSHQVAFRPIWKELARRGHEIVLLTTDPMKEDIENIRQIDMSFSYDILNKYNYSSVVSSQDTNFFLSIDNILNGFAESNRKQLEHPEVQQIIHDEKGKFDLLMIEVLFPTHLGFADRFKVPIIGLTSFDAPQTIHEVMGNGAHPVANPDASIPYSFPPSFWQRAGSTLLQLALRIYGEFFILPREEATNKLIFGENGPTLYDLCTEIDMLFINVNPIFHTVRAITPNTITFGGGTHVESKPQPLPSDLNVILDNATEGFIYFSLGSNVKSYMLKDEMKKMILDTFSELPYKVLWKFETDEYLLNKPDNVIIKKWFPQTSVLKHRNIKLFISQCGLQSLEEAIMNHVPIVGIPFIADQQSNSNMVENKGMGKTLNIKTLTKEIFKNAILEVVVNPMYKKNVKEVEELVSDVEMTGLEKAVWWTEYVLRHKGAKHLRNPVLRVPYYQYFLLDVVAFVALVTFFVSWGIKKIVSKIVSRMSNKRAKD